MSLAPLYGNEPRTRPTSASQTRSGNNSFDLQRMETDLRHRQEQLADERARLGEERRAIARERAELDARRDEQRDQQITERHAAANRSAEVLAGDLAHDISDAAPGYVASQILAAADKARGLSGVEEPTGLAAAIVHAGRLASGTARAAPALPENATARAVVLSGRRARGEAVSESDAVFLSAFLQKMGPRT